MSREILADNGITGETALGALIGAGGYGQPILTVNGTITLDFFSSGRGACPGCTGLAR